MCGLAGILGTQDEAAIGATARMTDAMVHRGPDQAGIWRSAIDPGVVLGHRRLSILDLSEAGRQPMVDEATGVAIVFNGECYNFLELRAELEHAGRRFTSAGDTEVVLAAYVVWGEDFVQKLRGMFAIAIWDPRSRNLILARDRLGIKPLYYVELDGRLLFASELRALLASDIVARRLDPVALEAYLWHGFVPGPRTLVEGLRLLPAAHVLHATAGQKPELRAYWRYPRHRVEPSRDAAVVVKEKLQEAVAQHLVSDVPIGVFLSGGIDSSVVAALAQRASDQAVRTFNVRFEESVYDESLNARQISQLLGTEHYELVLTESCFADHLDEALEGVDQPTFDALNTYFVSRSVREAGLKVALAGTGGDELFGGYSSFVDLPRARRSAKFLGMLPGDAARLGRKVASRLMLGVPSEVPPQARWGKLVDLAATKGDLLAMYQVSYGLFTRDFLDSLLLAPQRSTRFGLCPELAKAWSGRIEGEPELESISSLEVASFLGERLLRDTDSASMAVSLEARVPFLDHEFVEAVAMLPGGLRFHPPRKKMMLRQIISSQVPPEFFDREKMGFELPMQLWCRRMLSSRLATTFRDLNLMHSIGLNAEAVGRLWRAFLKGGAGVYWSRIWSLFVLLTWCRRHGVYL